MFGRKLINESVEWLGVPSFLHNYGPPWADNILCISLCWGVGGNIENWYLESQPGGRYGGVDVPWRGAVPACLAYLPRSLENARATVRRIRNNIRQEYCLAHAQSLSDN